MQRLFKTVSRPSVTPVSLDDFKEHLKFVGTYEREDSTLRIYLSAACDFAEDYIGYKIMQQTSSVIYTGLSTDWLELYPNVTSITHVKYKEDIDDASYTTLSASEYELMAYDPLSVIRFDTVQNYDIYEITFVSGYSSSDDVDYKIKAAILMIAARLYAKKEDSIKKMPTAAEELLDLSRIKAFL